MKDILKNINRAKKILKPMSDLKEKQSKSTDNIIRNHALWSMGAGALIPIPLLDSAGVAAIQLDMIRQMTKVYHVDFEDTRYKAIVSTVLGTFLARAGAKSLIKLIPIAGSYIGGAAMGVMAGASTYTLGELFKTHFENGGTMLDIDLDSMKRQFEEKFEKNKKVVEKIKEEHEKKRKEGNDDGDFVVHENTTEDVIEDTTKDLKVTDGKDILKELEKLYDLKDKGAITDTEFKALKKKIIDNFK